MATSASLCGTVAAGRLDAVYGACFINLAGPGLKTFQSSRENKLRNRDFTVDATWKCVKKNGLHHAARWHVYCRRILPTDRSATQRGHVYYRHFCLTGPPFEAAVAPNALYLSRANRESLAALEWGLLHEPSGFTTLTGETGTGKTTLVCSILAREFTANGVLMTVIGLLARELRLSASALRIWFWTLVIGTWTNGSAGRVGAFAGQSSPLMPTLNQTFPAPGGDANPVVTGLLLVCSVTIIIALLLTIVGLARAPHAQLE
jgi:hypothetical protein